jgi:hypothetical protein
VCRWCGTLRSLPAGCADHGCRIDQFGGDRDVAVFDGVTIPSSVRAAVAAECGIDSMPWLGCPTAWIDAVAA